MKTQFVTDDNGKKVGVLLPIREYERILEELEELEDIRLYDEVKKRNEDRVSFEEYLKKRNRKKHA